MVPLVRVGLTVHIRDDVEAALSMVRVVHASACREQAGIAGFVSFPWTQMVCEPGRKVLRDSGER